MHFRIFTVNKSSEKNPETAEEFATFVDIIPIIIGLLFMVGVYAASIILWGESGYLIYLLICLFWCTVFIRHKVIGPFVRISFISLFTFILLGSCTACSINGPLHTGCRHRLRNIGIALHNYHDTYGSFPPAFIADENGIPQHSWRVLILPYMDHQELYDKYSFDEPWDGPNNIKLLDQIPDIYRCPADKHRNGQSTHTSYLAVLGENTFWPGTRGRTIKEITDGTSNTIAVMECHSQGIHWIEPRDLSYGNAMQIVTSTDMNEMSGHRYIGFFSDESSGRHLLIADGSVRRIDHHGDQRNWSDWFLIDDGRSAEDLEKIYSESYTKEQRNPDNIIKFMSFLFLCMLPLSWVWLKPRKNPTDKFEAAYDMLQHLS